MADKQAITELLNKGGWAYDTPDVEFLADMFTEDGKFDLQIQKNDVINFSGRANIRSLYENSLATQTDQRRHVVTNLFFSDEKDNSITATSYLILIAVAEGKLNVLSTGVYTDKVVKDGNSWRIKHRFLYLDLPY